MSVSLAVVPRVEVALSPGAAWIRLSGEVDVTAVPALHRAIDTALETGSPVWLDLAGVTFLDASCVHEVLYLQLRAAARDTCFLMMPPSRPEVMLPFDLLDLVDDLPLVVPPPGPQQRRDRLRGLPTLQDVTGSDEQATDRSPSLGRRPACRRRDAS